MLATLIFMGAALALATYLVFTSVHSSRTEARELAAAREREAIALRDAERARALRAEWEAKIAAEQLLAAADDPRGFGDGLGRDEAPVPAPIRTGRFRRDVPAPFSTAR